MLSSGSRGADPRSDYGNDIPARIRFTPIIGTDAAIRLYKCYFDICVSSPVIDLEEYAQCGFLHLYVGMSNIQFTVRSGTFTGRKEDGVGSAIDDENCSLRPFQFCQFRPKQFLR